MGKNGMEYGLFKFIDDETETIFNELMSITDSYLSSSIKLYPPNYGEYYFKSL